jgi:hypothetical protein
MNKKLLIAAGFALAAATMAGQAPAQANGNAPWCASPYLSGGAQLCNFVTFAQCQAYLQGITGQCNPNYRAAYDAHGYYDAPAPVYVPAPRHYR